MSLQCTSLSVSVYCYYFLHYDSGLFRRCLAKLAVCLSSRLRRCHLHRVTSTGNNDDDDDDEVMVIGDILSKRLCEILN